MLYPWSMCAVRHVYDSGASQGYISCMSAYFISMEVKICIAVICCIRLLWRTSFIFPEYDTNRYKAMALLWHFNSTEEAGNNEPLKMVHWTISSNCKRFKLQHLLNAVLKVFWLTKARRTAEKHYLALSENSR